MADALNRIQLHGLESAGTVDLLTVAATREARDLELNSATAQDLVHRMPGARLLNLSLEDLQNRFGLEPYESMRVLAAIQLGRRVGLASEEKRDAINSSVDAFRHFAYMRGKPSEEFHLCLLDTKNQILETTMVHRGTLNMSVVGGREVFRLAIRGNAKNIIVAHNHPSGDPTPSPEDIAVTQKLREIGDLLDIPLLDHIIVGQNQSVSLQELGYVR